jgi:hypothetical protein
LQSGSTHGMNSMNGAAQEFYDQKTIAGEEAYF